jgi:uncharacterized glyoxalase superfamily protein PhnB
VEFYTKLLGFKLFTDQPAGEDNRWVELQIPGADTRFVLTTFNAPPDPSRVTPTCVFVADNLHRTYEELKAKGVEFTQPPTRAFWGDSAMFRDSEGNLLLLGTA